MVCELDPNQVVYFLKHQWAWQEDSGNTQPKPVQCHVGVSESNKLGSNVGEGNGTPLQYFCLENTMDGGAWWAR